MTYPPGIHWLELPSGRCIPVHVEPRQLAVFLRSDGAAVASVPDEGRMLAFRRGLGPAAARKHPDGSVVLLNLDDLSPADLRLLDALEAAAPDLWPSNP